MSANTNQIDELNTAAQWLVARQAEVMPAFRLQNVTVHILTDPSNPEDGYAEAVFTWVTDHYEFTVSP